QFEDGCGFRKRFRNFEIFEHRFFFGMILPLIGLNRFIFIIWILQFRMLGIEFGYHCLEVLVGEVVKVVKSL
ncbi:MAG: hypothetical protein ABID54_05115, partial [Pseudomonadota bacterium]